MLIRLDIRDVIDILHKYGYSNAEIAKETGVDRPSVSRIANGLVQPRRETYQKILDLAERESAKNVELCKRLISLINEGGGGYL